VKGVVVRDKHGHLRAANPRCRAWAMPNGRCRMHGGASTGPKTPEGKARVVAAMVAGRRAWVERQRAESKKIAGGRKRGEAWITEAMRERARAETLRLGGDGLKLNRLLTLALLRSAKGDLRALALAQDLIAEAKRAEFERSVEEATRIVFDIMDRRAHGNAI
jgi:hypothetical protein